MKNTTVSNIEKFPVPEYPPTWEKKKKKKRKERTRKAKENSSSIKLLLFR